MADIAQSIANLNSRLDNLSIDLQLFNATLETSALENRQISGQLWRLQAAFFVFLMQVGFSLVEAGTVRVKNTRNIMVKNVLDMCICVISFWFFGYALSFGEGNAVVGWKYPDGQPAFFGNRDNVKFFFDVAFATTCATIIAGSIAERTQLRAYLIYSFFLSSFIYPVTAHLIWSKHGLLSPTSTKKILGTDGVLDNAGSMVVHVTGGATALVGAWMVGPRIGRFDIEGNPVPMQSHSMALVAAGTLLLWVSFFGFNTGPVEIGIYHKTWPAEIGRVAQNTALTAAFSGLGVYIFTQTVNKRSKPEDVFNAVIGGLVAACATSSVVQPYGAAVTGFVAGFVYLCGVKVMTRFQIDDVVMAAPVHLFCGTWGGLAVGLFATRDNVQRSFNIDDPQAWGLFHKGGVRQLLVQILGLFTVYLWVGISSFVLFYLLAFCNALRVDRQEEEAGLDLAFHGGEEKDTSDLWRRDSRRQIDFVRNRKIFSVGQLQGKLRAIFQPRKGDRSLKSSLWHKSLKRTAFGEFSFAMYEANYFMEDAGEVEATLSGVYIGVHDGHGGTEASKYLKDHLYENLKGRILENNGAVSAEEIKAAFADTEGDFVHIVRDAFQSSPHLATVGSCSVVAIITGEALYIANLGDSRAVLGCRRKDGLYPIQLSEDDNVNLPEVREAYNQEHENCCGGNLVWEKNGIWRIKGKLQVVRSFGDLFMKHREFNRDPLFSRFRVPEPFVPPLLSAEPSVTLHMLTANDEFLIIASDGLWEFLSNEEALEIVAGNGRKDIARILIKCALQRAARKHEVTYADLLQMPGGQRREYHDDMTVIVFFFRHGTKQKQSAAETWKQSLSLKGGTEAKEALTSSHIPTNLRLRHAEGRNSMLREPRPRRLEDDNIIEV